MQFQKGVYLISVKGILLIEKRKLNYSEVVQ